MEENNEYIILNGDGELVIRFFISNGRVAVIKIERGFEILQVSGSLKSFYEDKQEAKDG